MFQQNVSKRTFEFFFYACSISLCTLLPADWQYLHSSFVAIEGLNQKSIAHDLFYFLLLLFLKRPSPDASSSGRDFADLWLFPHDENHTSMTNINFRADFVDRYASIVLDHFPIFASIFTGVTLVPGRRGRDTFRTYRRPLENNLRHANTRVLHNVPSPNCSRGLCKIPVSIVLSTAKNSIIVRCATEDVLLLRPLCFLLNDE